MNTKDLSFFSLSNFSKITLSIDFSKDITVAWTILKKRRRLEIR